MKRVTMVVLRDGLERCVPEPSRIRSSPAVLRNHVRFSAFVPLCLVAILLLTAVACETAPPPRTSSTGSTTDRLENSRRQRWAELESQRVRTTTGRPTNIENVFGTLQANRNIVTFFWDIRTSSSLAEYGQGLERQLRQTAKDQLNTVQWGLRETTNENVANFIVAVDAYSHVARADWRIMVMESEYRYRLIDAQRSIVLAEDTYVRRQYLSDGSSVIVRSEWLESPDAAVRTQPSIDTGPTVIGDWTVSIDLDHGQRVLVALTAAKQMDGLSRPPILGIDWARGDGWNIRIMWYSAPVVEDTIRIAFTEDQLYAVPVTVALENIVSLEDPGDFLNFLVHLDENGQLYDMFGAALTESGVVTAVWELSGFDRVLQWFMDQADY